MMTVFFPDYVRERACWCRAEADKRHYVAQLNFLQRRKSSCGVKFSETNFQPPNVHEFKRSTHSPLT
jgi:hypothetical protein